jgi:hypothetical protein
LAPSPRTNDHTIGKIIAEAMDKVGKDGVITVEEAKTMETALEVVEGKDQFGVQGKTVLLTLGLLSPNKGIEHVLDALPAVLARHPNVVYIVLGATHPHVKANGVRRTVSRSNAAPSIMAWSHTSFSSIAL